MAFFGKGIRRYSNAHIRVLEIKRDIEREISTRVVFGKILDKLAKGNSDPADRISTTSPDVTGTTSLGSFVNRRKPFARDEQKDAFIEYRMPSAAKWNFAFQGQHIEPGIADMNLFLLPGRCVIISQRMRETAYADWHHL